jgi:hypothetical protein
MPQLSAVFGNVWLPRNADREARRRGGATGGSTGHCNTVPVAILDANQWSVSVTALHGPARSYRRYPYDKAVAIPADIRIPGLEVLLGECTETGYYLGAKLGVLSLPPGLAVASDSGLGGSRGSGDCARHGHVPGSVGCNAVVVVGQ